MKLLSEMPITPIVSDADNLQVLEALQATRSLVLDLYRHGKWITDMSHSTVSYDTGWYWIRTDDLRVRI